MLNMTLSILLHSMILLLLLSVLILIIKKCNLKTSTFVLQFCIIQSILHFFAYFNLEWYLNLSPYTLSVYIVSLLAPLAQYISIFIKNQASKGLYRDTDINKNPFKLWLINHITSYDFLKNTIIMVTCLQFLKCIVIPYCLSLITVEYLSPSTIAFFILSFLAPIIQEVIEIWNDAKIPLGLSSNINNNGSKLTTGNYVSCESCGKPCEGSSKDGFRENQNTSENLKEDSDSVISENSRHTYEEDSESEKSIHDHANATFINNQVDKSTEMQQYFIKNMQEISEERKKISGLIPYAPGETEADVWAKIRVLQQEGENAKLQDQPVSRTNNLSNSKLERDPFPEKKGKGKEE